MKPKKHPDQGEGTMSMQPPRHDPFKPLYLNSEAADDDHAGYIMRMLNLLKDRVLPSPQTPHQIESNRQAKLRNDRIDAAIEWVLKMDGPSSGGTPHPGQ